MNHLRRRAVVASMAFGVVRAFAQDAQVLLLQHRRADEVIPMLRPYLDPAGRITGEGDRLYVQTTLQNLAQIRQLLATLDRPPRWLTIDVRQDRPPVGRNDVRAPHAAVLTESRSAAAPAGDDASRTTRARSSDERVRVLEGGRALIQFQAAVPMTFRHFALGKGEVEELPGAVSYDALVEFVVTPRLAGTAVTLEIEPQDGSILTDGGERGRLSTTVHGRLGDWIAVGGADLREDTVTSNSSPGRVRAQTRPTTSQRGVWLKVDLSEEGAR